jgi:hypothetical protein
MIATLPRATRLDRFEQALLQQSAGSIAVQVRIGFAFSRLHVFRRFGIAVVVKDRGHVRIAAQLTIPAEGFVDRAKFVVLFIVRRINIVIAFVAQLPTTLEKIESR